MENSNKDIFYNDGLQIDFINGFERKRKLKPYLIVRDVK